MNNFQLYRSNVFLGGQLKWDIIIDSIDNTLCVSDFHLSPISPNIPYIYKSEDTLLNNTHHDNIKEFYNKIKSNFYSEGLDSNFNHNWPILCKDEEKVDCYSNIYDMGCKRSFSYNRYNKQFEFFCPLWIEHMYDDLKFELLIKNLYSDSIISKKYLILKPNDLLKHNKFVTYLNEYIHSTNLDNGNDQLININLKENSAYINGINVSNGTVCTKNIDDLIDNLLIIERPLMESDKLIIESFPNNLMIAKQLFNFNLCFNIDDILSGSIVDIINGKNFSVSLNVYIGNDLLEKRDFYTEYEFINKDINTNIINEDIKINVLDYLHDYECIEMINKNKFCQKICHWSLNDNNDYIFNLYDGFSGISVNIDKDKKYTYNTNDHQYGNVSNTNVKISDNSGIATKWINGTVISYWSEFYKYILNTDKNKSNGIYIHKNKYINNIKYSYIPEFNNSGVYCIGFNVTDDIFVNIIDSHNYFDLTFYLKIDDNLIIMQKNDLIMIISNKLDKLTFSNVFDSFYEHINKNDSNNNSNDESKLKADKCINELFKMMKGKIDPNLIILNNSLEWESTNGPSKYIKEIEYLVSTKTQYILRYDGNIKPTFISPDQKNTLYYKDIVNISNYDSTKYKEYIKFGFEPLYPSIDYCAINKLLDWSYNKLPKVEFSNNKVASIFNDYEYSWFENNILMILKPEIIFDIKNTKNIDGEYESSENLIIQYLKEFYQIEDDFKIRYILSKYSISNNWDYYSNTNIDDHIHHITLKLK